ncbi:MAG: phospho-sugar mutase [Candidatus Sumerlaeia bacterium]|nr:phospho-sugar mutase [Candidatus Sumerlaeia bacterium]
MLSKTALKRIRQWLESDLDAASRWEVQRLLDAGEEAELEDRFAFDLEFGTGGLRGVMAAGTNRMNTYTVARATQGLADYIHRQCIRRPSAVVAYDSRHHSRDFARTTAEVFAANGIRVFLFRHLRPTPLLSFAVRHFGATAGVVITSSHNPKQYNGYKCCWSDGAQVVPPHDVGIIRQVKRITSPGQIRRMDFARAVRLGRIKLIGAGVDRVYLRAIRPLSLHPEIIRSVGRDLKIVYTPLHGTGGTMVPKALRDWGFRRVALVPSQARPDGDFPTVESPNPEDPAAMAEAIAVARRTDADLVLASDPDADRLGVAVRIARGRYQMLTGNQVGVLLADYLCREMNAVGTLPDNALIVTTIVSTDLIERVGAYYGVAVEEVLTGFKWICERIRANEERRARGKSWLSFIFGTEESYGYLVGTVARDKDSVIASCVCAEMAAVARSRGKTLVQELDAIEMRHGVFLEEGQSIFHPGVEGAAMIKRIMDSLRKNPPRRIGSLPVVRVGDVLRGLWRPLPDGRGTSSRRGGRIALPKSDVLIFELADGGKVIARPSGTEPKIKFYFNLCECEGIPFTSRAQLEKARRALADKMQRIKADFLREVEARGK